MPIRRSLCIGVFLLLTPMAGHAALVRYDFQTTVGPGSMPAPPFDVDGYGFSREPVSVSYVVNTATPATFFAGPYFSYPNAVVSWTLASADGILNMSGLGGFVTADGSDGMDTVTISGSAPAGTTQFGPFSVFGVAVQLVGSFGNLGAFYNSLPEILPSLEQANVDQTVFVMMTDGVNYRTADYLLTEMSASPVPEPASVALVLSGLMCCASVLSFRRWSSGSRQ
jgi:hypothetical protein